MTTKHIKITDGAKEELRRATINGDKLNFQGQLKNYGEIKKLFLHLGITWHKGEKQHYIEGSTPQRIQEVLGGTQIIDEKKTLQQFYTPASVAKKAVSLLKVECCDSILEPSAGSGNLIRALKPRKEGVHVTAIEINEGCRVDLEAADLAMWTIVHIEDFLKMELGDLSWNDRLFDKILMNPPYDKNTWVKHIEHAWKFLKDGGRLVAICPNAKHNKFFQKFIGGKDYKIEDVPAGEFSSSGTEIATMIVVINK